jgi:hypothetical protein
MLVDKKFMFISLPRCASTSFMITCVRNNISLNHLQSPLDNQLSYIDNWEKMNNEELADTLTHAHEPLYNLIEKFGNDYPIISVKRNEYERFISLWKHIIDETHRIGQTEIANMFTKLTADDLLNFDSNNLVDNAIDSHVQLFFEKFNIPKEAIYIFNMMRIMYHPTSFWTNNDPRIIWFDISELNKLEDWVSNKIQKPFKLEKVNSSQHFECGLKLNDDFIKKYDNIYKVFDKPKKQKTLI